MKVKLCFSMIMFSLALTIFGASKNVSAQAQGHVTQYLYKGYKVTYTINSEWEDCYIASLTIESTGEYAIDNYALSFFMNDMIEEIWGADIYSYWDNMPSHAIDNGWGAAPCPLRKGSAVR